MRCRYIVNASTNTERSMSVMMRSHDPHFHGRRECAACGVSGAGSRSAAPGSVGSAAVSARAWRPGLAGRRGAAAAAPAQRPRRGARAAARAADARLRDDPGAREPHRRHLAPEPRLGLPDPAAAGGRGPHRRPRQSGGRKGYTLTDAGRAEAEAAAQNPPWAQYRRRRPCRRRRTSATPRRHHGRAPPGRLQRHRRAAPRALEVLNETKRKLYAILADSE